MVVERRHAENFVRVRVLLPVAALAPAIHAGLHDHRDRFRGKDAARDEQQKLRLEQNRDGTQCAADRERTGVAHEDLSGMRIEPQKSERRAHEGAAKDRQLAGAREIEDAEIMRRVRAAEQVREDRERTGRDGGQSRGESVQTVGEIHRVRASGDDDGDENDVGPPRQLYEDVLEERQLRGRRLDARRDRHEYEHDAEREAERDLPHQFPARDQTLRLAPHDLEIVVQKPDQAHPQRGNDGDDDVAAIEPGPQQRRHDGGEDNDQSTHRRRASLAVMARGSFRAHDLADTEVAQLGNDAWTDDEGNEQRRHGRARRPERDVVEEIEDDVLAGEWREQVIEHQVM